MVKLSYVIRELEKSMLSNVKSWNLAIWYIKIHYFLGKHLKIFLKNYFKYLCVKI